MTVPQRQPVMVSDFLLVRHRGAELWQAFRDVAEVDKESVRDREDQMMKLFLQPSSDAFTTSRRLSQQGARGTTSLTSKDQQPLLVMALQRQYADRFRFNLAGRDTDLGPDVRTVRFVEVRQPALLKWNASTDLSSRGLMWIEEHTGRVVKTQLQLGGVRHPIRVTTTFTWDAELGMNVPTLMEDWYPQGSGEFRGKATYGKFRRFEIKTDERFKP
jgi:hypothetical protein